jgi:hypothetical protein
MSSVLDAFRKQTEKHLPVLLRPHKPVGPFISFKFGMVDVTKFCRAFLNLAEIFLLVF